MNIDYGKNLKKLREEKEINQKVLAEAIGIKRSTYNQYEQQYDIIPIQRLNMIANYFKVSIDYILGFTINYTYSNIKAELDIDLSKRRLKEFRKENKLTQEKLANIFKSSRMVIVCYEQGKNYIPTSYLYTICKKYGISADYLLGKIDTPKYLK